MNLKPMQAQYIHLMNGNVAHTINIHNTPMIQSACSSVIFHPNLGLY
jgi:hypothetical protein